MVVMAVAAAVVRGCFFTGGVFILFCPVLFAS